MNGSQVEAVLYTVSGLVNGELPRIKLIQGPPGTGKTSLLVSLLSVLGSLNYRIHMVAPTNTAICEVASRFLSRMLGDCESPDAGFVQFGSCFHGTVRNRGKSSRILHSGDVVLVGNEDALASNSAQDFLSDMYLPARVQRLAQALCPTTGYRISAQSVVNLIKQAQEEYGLYKQCACDDDVEPFELYVTRKIQDLCSSVVTKGDVMCRDLPSGVLDSAPRQLLERMLRLVKQILQYITCIQKSDGYEQIGRFFCSAPPEILAGNCGQSSVSERSTMEISNFDLLRPRFISWGFWKRARDMKCSVAGVPPSRK